MITLTFASSLPLNVDFVRSPGSLQEQTSVLPSSSEGQHTTTAGKVLMQ